MPYCEIPSELDRGVTIKSTLSKEWPMPESQEMLRRGEHHTNFRRSIERIDAQSLTPGEREQFLDAADMLLFDEPDAQAAKVKVFTLIEQFVGSALRHDWNETRAAEIKEALDGCGQAIQSEPSASA